jgi:hypothetical protein
MVLRPRLLVVTLYATDEHLKVYSLGVPGPSFIRLAAYGPHTLGKSTIMHNDTNDNTQKVSSPGKSFRMSCLGWLLFGFFLGIGWTLSIVRPEPTPVHTTIHDLRDEVLDYRRQHGDFPTSLDFLPLRLKQQVDMFHISYDHKDKRLFADASLCWYDPSFLYVVTRGMLGSRVHCSSPGFNFDIITK